MTRDYLCAAAALMAAAAVGLGAYGAHGLHVDDSIKRMWETGVAYQMWHALGAFAAAWIAVRRSGIAAKAANAAGCLFLIGSVLFSGSLYWFVLAGIIPVTGAAPAGGIFMIVGWLILALAALSRSQPNSQPSA